MASFHKPARYCQSSDPLGNMEQQSASAIRYQPSALDQKFGERPVSGSAQNWHFPSSYAWIYRLADSSYRNRLAFSNCFMMSAQFFLSPSSISY